MQNPIAKPKQILQNPWNSLKWDKKSTCPPRASDFRVFFVKNRQNSWNPVNSDENPKVMVCDAGNTPIFIDFHL